MITLSAFATWLEDDLRRATLPDRTQMWRVRRVIVTRAAVDAFDLAIPDLGVMAIAGTAIPLNVLDAIAEDVWIELAPLDPIDGDPEVIYRPLTLGLDADQRVVYTALRTGECDPTAALLVSHAVVASAPGGRG